MDPYSSFLLENEDSEVPLGFRFRPSDVELMEYYLLRKIKGEQLASNFIKDLNVYQYDPPQLPLSQFKNAIKNEGYFFTMVKRKKFLNDNTTRTTPNGYWKAYNENIPMYGAKGIIGFKDKYSFYDGKDPNGDKTDWKMIEYRCNPSLVPAASTSGTENYIVCKVMHKKKTEEGETVLEGNVEDENM
ncbi:hypothetical protein BUALT_Bualt17G0079500 [Buddleja alternifolia]|uniref:NAC domain-containing protein n=1 Tax=Buddleja alternifolia TaxID=168488 RepID=A0AAV6WHG0_9LAMI|nr:hypothetical protein BUALT_Bualt17G0079500 [Buddleja alternifolia]